MSARDDSGSAFPIEGFEDRDRWIRSGGLTKRELFAAMAMQGLLAQSDEEGNGWSAESPYREKAAQEAVAFADALLAALQSPPPEAQP